jgi:hypothetical protein
MRRREPTVTPEEFAERKAQLEAERRRGIELIEAVYREQLRGLEVLLAAGGGASAATPAVSAPPPAAPASALLQALAPAPAAPSSLQVPAPAASPSAQAPAPAVAAAAAPVRRSSTELWWDLQEALPRLPEVFTTPQLKRVLGYSPHRGTLHRHLAELESEGRLRCEFRGDGRRLSRFRRLSPRGAAAAGDGDGGEMAQTAPAAAVQEEGDGRSEAPAETEREAAPPDGADQAAGDPGSGGSVG